MARTTLQTIADHVGVSRMTVSNAFSRPDQLSAELRERILAAADELGYAGPDPAARALARGAAGTVGVLLADSIADAFRDDVTTAFLGAIADELARTGLALTLFSTAAAGTVVPGRDIALDGALVYSTDPGSSALDWLRRRGLPLVFVDQEVESGVPSVNIDDRGGARAAARHLLGLGHRRILILCPDDDARRGCGPHPTRERLAGWTRELRAAGVAVEIADTPHPPVEAASDLRALLRGPRRPTGVLCYSDAIALHAIREAEALGLRVPDDLSVVGFDDSPILRGVRPALTTIRQDLEAKGRAAARALLLAIERGGASTARARHVVLPAELVVRESTARCRAR